MKWCGGNGDEGGGVPNDTKQKDFPPDNDGKTF